MPHENQICRTPFSANDKGLSRSTRVSVSRGGRGRDSWRKLACTAKPFHCRLFVRNSNSKEGLFGYKSISESQIITNFRTWHDSTAVVPWAKSNSERFIRIWTILRRNFWFWWKYIWWNGCRCVEWRAGRKCYVKWPSSRSSQGFSKSCIQGYLPNRLTAPCKPINQTEYAPTNRPNNGAEDYSHTYSYVGTFGFNMFVLDHHGFWLY